MISSLDKTIKLLREIDCVEIYNALNDAIPMADRKKLIGVYDRLGTLGDIHITLHYATVLNPFLMPAVKSDYELYCASYILLEAFLGYRDYETFVEKSKIMTPSDLYNRLGKPIINHDVEVVKL